MTETTQPDPQVVAWMRGYLRDARQQDAPYSKATASRAWLDAHGYDSLSDSPYQLRDLINAYDAARKPLTVADIPAGQGPASLFIERDGDGDMAVWFKDAAGILRARYYRDAYPTDDPLWEHLAATLPHITTEEEA